MIFIIFLPGRGYAGLVMRIYPLVAAGYFLLFLMYAEIIFLFYFEDLKGALGTAISFCIVTLIGSLAATHFNAIFYGTGIWLGAMVGFTLSYMRLRWLERNLDEHMFCRGNIMKQAKGIKPSPKVFDLREQKKSEASLEIETQETKEGGTKR